MSESPGEATPHAASRRTSLLLLAGTLAAAVAAIGAVAVGAEIADRPVDNFTRDPFETLGGPAYIGLLSHVGVLLLWGAAVACSVCAALLLRGDAARALVAAALVSAYLALDDLFGLHEHLYEGRMGVPQWFVYGLYTAVGALVAIRHRQFFRHTAWPLLAVALAFLGASGVVDIVGGATGAHRPAAEDSLKLLGIAVWTTYLVLTALTAAGAPSQRPAAPGVSVPHGRRTGW